jgi:hypothetical protein
MKLTDLKITAEKRPTPTWRVSAQERMRANLTKAIDVQRQLLQAERTGQSPNLTKMVRRVDDSGTTVEETVARRPRKWFWRAASGTYFLEVYYASKPVPLAVGKTAIECGDLDGVDRTLDFLAAAASAGELDKPLGDLKSGRKAAKKGA